jgi:hypothetical protein
VESIAVLLEQLTSNNEEVQDRAVKELAEIDVNDEDAASLIAAAARSYPHDDSRFEAIGLQILDDCWRDPRPEYIRAVEEHYGDLCQNDDARWRALRILTELKSRDALKTFVRLLRRPGSRTVHLELPLVPLIGSSTWGGKRPDPAGVELFPEFLDLAENLNDVHHVYWTIQMYHEAGVICYDDHPGFVDRCIERAKSAIEALRCSAAGESDSPLSTADAERIHKASLELEWLLDIFRDMEHPTIPDIVSRACELPAPMIRLFGAACAIARGEPVPETLLEDLADQPSMRYRLWRLLEQVDQLDRFPRRFAGQPHLAEAEMVHWLEFPTEMGQAPDEIELLSTVDSKTGQRFFCFRFRAAAFRDGKWFVGVAGPYSAEGRPSMDGAKTFSRFDEWESKSLEEHIRDYVEMA